MNYNSNHETLCFKLTSVYRDLYFIEVYAAHEIILFMYFNDAIKRREWKDKSPSKTDCEHNMHLCI